MGFLSRLLRRRERAEEKPSVESEDFYDDDEEIPEDPTLQSLGGPRYALSQILRDFENFGLYELSKKPKKLASVNNPEELARAIEYTLKPPEGRQLYLAANYKASLIIFYR